MEKEAEGSTVKVKCFVHDKIPSFGAERERGWGDSCRQFCRTSGKRQQEDGKLCVEVFFYS